MRSLLNQRAGLPGNPEVEGLLALELYYRARIDSRFGRRGDGQLELVNRAVAVAMADGAPAGLALLEQVHGLDEYHLFWAARAELLLRNGDRDAAASSFAKARALAANPAEQRHLDARIAVLG